MRASYIIHKGKTKEITVYWQFTLNFLDQNNAKSQKWSQSLMGAVAYEGFLIQSLSLRSGFHNSGHN